MSKGAMGSRAALAEAVRRWGPKAGIQSQPGSCKVGRFFFFKFWAEGQGKTWSAAFRHVDRRAGKQTTVSPCPSGEGGKD